MKLFKRDASFIVPVFESCFVHKVLGKSVDADDWNVGEPMNLTSQALVGIVVTEQSEKMVVWPTTDHKTAEPENYDGKGLHKKMKIFVCDDDFDMDETSAR